MSTKPKPVSAKSFPALPGWKRAGEAIEKTFAFENYYHTIAFVNLIAALAHKSDHHPDLSVHYNKCVVRFSTHSLGKLSTLDIASAKAIEAALKL
jgi:4a-hydroxytetrahydrobiopterin dehydratase